jgi:hypothetical protein
VPAHCAQESSKKIKEAKKINRVKYLLIDRFVQNKKTKASKTSFSDSNKQKETLFLAQYDALGDKAKEEATNGHKPLLNG